MDRRTLPRAFGRARTGLPEGAAVYAARIVPGVGGPAYVPFEAGGGAFADGFWPASTVKVLAAVGALDFARTLGMTGAATVTFPDGTRDTLRAICDRAIRDSNNDDYDRTVLVAGVDRLNDELLDAAHGLGSIVIQRSYTGQGVRVSPPLVLAEGGRTVEVPRRSGREDHGCADGGNCANLFELTEAVRRIVLDEEIPPAERFDLDRRDLVALRDALCNTDSSYFLDGARRALGGEPRICHKTGSVRDRDYLDHGVIEDPATGRRWLLAVSIPDQGGSTVSREAVGVVAERVLRALGGEEGGVPLQADAGVPIVVQVEREAGARRGRGWVLTIEAAGADEVEAWADGTALGKATGSGPRFELRPAVVLRDERLVVVAARRSGEAVGWRSLRVRFEAEAAGGAGGR